MRFEERLGNASRRAAIALALCASATASACAALTCAPESAAAVTPGPVWAWGEGVTAQLGNNSLSNSDTPIQVLGVGGAGTLNNAVSVAVGGSHSLAATSDGSVWAWGRNPQGELGVNTFTGPDTCPGSTPCSKTPVQVLGPGGTGTLGGVTAVAGGNLFSLALKSDGSVWAWGYNVWGQLGDNTTTGPDACTGSSACSMTPVQVLGSGGTGTLSAITAIAAGSEHSLALKSDGTVWAWGHNNEGQLGNNSTTNSSTPVQVQAPGGGGMLTGVVAIAAGGLTSYAVKSDGSVLAWGIDYMGQLGDNNSAPSSCSGSPCSMAPLFVAGPGGTGTLGGAVAIAGGAEHALVLKSDGSVWAWGDATLGELGNNNTSGSTTCAAGNACTPAPVQVRGVGGTGTLGGVTAIATGGGNSYALESDPSVLAWGANQFGQLGDGTNTGPGGCIPPGFATACSATPVQTNSFGFGASALSTSCCGVTELAIAATTPPPPPPAPPVPPAAGVAPVKPHTATAAACSANSLILTDVFPSAGKTQLLGVAPQSAIGKRVMIVSAWNHKTVATATVQRDLTFSATAPLPPRSLRFTNRARYVAELGSLRSLVLKFARRLYTTQVALASNTLHFSGTVTPPLAKPAAPVLIRASASCSTIATGAVVANVKPSRSGSFSATFSLPAALQSAPVVYLRAETKVRKSARNEKTFPTFTLIRGLRIT